MIQVDAYGNRRLFRQGDHDRADNRKGSDRLVKLSVGHNDGYLMLLCLIDGGLQAFQGGRVERGDSVLLFFSDFQYLV